MSTSTSNIIDDLIKKLGDCVPDNLGEIKRDLETHFRRVLQSRLADWNLVTREEFDAQTKVLERTRALLETLKQNRMKKGIL